MIICEPKTKQASRYNTVWSKQAINVFLSASTNAAQNKKQGLSAWITHEH